MIRARHLVLQLMVPAALFAQQPVPRALTIEDYYRIKIVAAPRISPDGQWVSYMVSQRMEQDNSTKTERWRVRADGSAPPEMLADDNRGAGELNGGILSPDGKWSASLKRVQVERKANTYASDFERRHEERFKGKQFDWLRYKQDGRPAPLPDARDPSINPASEIVITAAGSGESRQLTTLGLQPNSLTWSADGSRIVFIANPEYRSETLYGGTELYSVTTDGVVTRLTDDEFVYATPRFSPDGKYLAFTTTLSTDYIIQKKLNHGGARDLHVIDAAGKRYNLTAKWDLEPGQPTWSPDSKYVYFTADVGGDSHLFRVAAAGGAVEQITRGARSIAAVTFDEAFKKMAYTVAVFDRPIEIYSANIDGTNEKQLTRVHDEYVRETTPSKAETLRFKSADGTEIEGFLLFPYNYRADGGPYPLIVSNHGGPHSAIGREYNFKNQFFAANGYFVLEVNFRSSTGYGDKFKWGTWGAWGTKDGQDVMAGIDHAISKYPIDRKRVGTTGHSYGGFMTNWLITQYPDRFAAAVSGAGISNWISDYGLADIARTKETEFFGKPWEPHAREIMIKQSPLYYADRVKAPTLFVHGEVDWRVPFAEAEQFYFALKKNGVPTKIIMYEGMPHGISGHWNNVHRMLNELRWWDQYLKGRPTM